MTKAEKGRTMTEAVAVRLVWVHLKPTARYEAQSIPRSDPRASSNYVRRGDCKRWPERLLGDPARLPDEWEIVSDDEAKKIKAALSAAEKGTTGKPAPKTEEPPTKG